MKAKLVIDVPKNCSSCDLESGSICTPIGKDIFDLRIIPEWCPLEIVPSLSEIKVQVERLVDIKNENIENYIKIFLKETQIDISLLVLCHEYIPNGFKVWLDLKEKH
jgi:hypothetical protein